MLPRLFAASLAPQSASTTLSIEHSNVSPVSDENTNSGDLTFEKSAGPLTSAVSMMRKLTQQD